MGDRPNVATLIGQHDDAALSALMTNLGCYCVETLMEAFNAAADERPTLFVAYTAEMVGPKCALSMRSIVNDKSGASPRWNCNLSLHPPQS